MSKACTQAAKKGVTPERAFATCKDRQPSCSGIMEMHLSCSCSCAGTGTRQHASCCPDDATPASTISYKGFVACALVSYQGTLVVYADTAYVREGATLIAMVNFELYRSHWHT